MQDGVKLGPAASAKSLKNAVSAANMAAPASRSYFCHEIGPELRQLLPLRAYPIAGGWPPHAAIGEEAGGESAEAPKAKKKVSAKRRRRGRKGQERSEL